MSRARSAPGVKTRFVLRCPDCGYENPFDDYGDAKAAQMNHGCPECDRGMGVSERRALPEGDFTSDDPGPDPHAAVEEHDTTETVEDGAVRVTVDVPAPHSEGESYHAEGSPCGTSSAATETREFDAATLADSELDACGNCTRYHGLPDYHRLDETAPEAEVATDGGQPVVPRAIDYVGDGEATAYTVIAERLYPEEHGALESAGFHSPTTFFMVLTPGSMYAHYDRHVLVNSLPGDADWLHEELKRLDEEVREMEVSGA